MCRMSLMDVASAAKYLISYINGEEYDISSFECVLKSVNGNNIKKYALVICKEDSRDMVEAAVASNNGNYVRNFKISPDVGCLVTLHDNPSIFDNEISFYPGSYCSQLMIPKEFDYVTIFLMKYINFMENQIANEQLIKSDDLEQMLSLFTTDRTSFRDLFSNIFKKVKTMFGNNK